MTSRTLTIEAIGQCETFPEFATLEVNVRGEGESATSARAVTRDRAATVRESLTAVPDDAVRTTDLRVEDTEEPFGPDTNAPYRASERLQIDCPPESVETVVLEATDAGGRVQSVEFQLRETVRQELQEEALAAATERAREKAERIAAVENLDVAAVQDVTVKDPPTETSSIVDEALDSSPDSHFQPSPVVVSETVEVVYELTKP